MTKALSNPKIFVPLLAIGVLLVLGLIGYYLLATNLNLHKITPEGK